MLEGPYLGQRPPGTTPEVFAAGLVSLEGARELNSVFSPDGRIFMFTRVVDGVFKMYFSAQNEHGAWSRPKLAGPSRSYPGHDDLDVMFAPGGKRLFFISNRPLPGYPLERRNIWYSDVSADGLGTPVALGPLVNGPEHEFYPMRVKEGSLHFSTRRKDGLVELDSYRVQFRDGSLAPPANLSPSINTKYSEGDIFVNAAKTLMIHNASGRPDGLGRGDLYMSRARSDGTWAQDRHLGKVINTEATEYCPIITPDGKYFFFTRGNDIMWVDAKILEATPRSRPRSKR